jgi:hypothetical protein
MRLAEKLDWKGLRFHFFLHVRFICLSPQTFRSVRISYVGDFVAHNYSIFSPITVESNLFYLTL